MTDPVTIGALPGDPYLAVDVQPDQVDGQFVVDASEVGGYDLLGWADGASSWVNVACDVTGLRYRRGVSRQLGVLTRAEAGEATVTLLDTQRRFDPTVNEDAIRTNTPLRIRAWGYTDLGVRWDAVLFTGKVRKVSMQYPRVGPPVATVLGSDLIADLARWTGPGRAEPGIGAGDTLLARAQRALTEMGWTPADWLSTDRDTYYAATLAPNTLKNPWTVINDATDAELGRVWVDKANRLVLRSRESLLTGPVRGTFSDLHGESVNGAPHCCYYDPVVVLDPETLTNNAIGARRIPNDGSNPLPESALVQAADTYSQARYGVWTTDERSLELQTDGQLAPWAQSLIITDGRPELRVDSVRPTPWNPNDLTTTLRAWPAVLATDIGDRWIVRSRPEEGPMLDLAVGVLGVDLTVTAGEPWDLSWTTTHAPYPGADNPTGWIVVGLSDVDGPDVLAPFGGSPGGIT